MQRWLQATSVGCASDLIQFDIGFLKRLHIYYSCFCDSTRFLLFFLTKSDMNDTFQLKFICFHIRPFLGIMLNLQLAYTN